MGGPAEFFDVPLSELRTRTSAKWTAFGGSDVLPLPVAEMDVRLAPPITRALHAAVDRSDTGYAGDPAALVAAFVGFADRRWGWPVDPSSVRTAADVAHAVVALLRVAIEPGDGVVLMPPVYPPFWSWLRSVDARPVEVPLLDVEHGGRMDLAGIGSALGAGARVILLCHPHNPTGSVHPAADLLALAALADRYGATVVSDEIHAPMAYPGAGFVPYLQAGPAAQRTGITVTSASKAWNLAGLKCALMVAGDGRRDVLDRVPPETGWGVGQFGVIAGIAAFAEGEKWLDDLVVALPAAAAHLAALLAEHLPSVRLHLPVAGYLAWLDCRETGLGDDPAQVFLDRGQVALHHGPEFGSPGKGFARINFGCSAQTLREAVRRMASLPLSR